VSNSTPDGLEFFTCVSLKYAPLANLKSVFTGSCLLLLVMVTVVIATMSMMSNVGLADHSGIPHGGINSLVI
jgi:hypothetical protein